MTLQPLMKCLHAIGRRLRAAIAAASGVEAQPRVGPFLATSAVRALQDVEPGPEAALSIRREIRARPALGRAALHAHLHHAVIRPAAVRLAPDAEIDIAAPPRFVVRDR